jgi:SAM-dependent methyltransferase
VIFPVREPQGGARPASRHEADLYDAYLERTAVYRAEVLARLRALAGGGPVLEVGDGLGPTARALAPAAGGPPLVRAFRAPSPWGWEIERARGARPGEEPARFAWVRCAETTLPFPNACFELVYADGQLRRWRDPVPVVAELLRVMREEGALLLHDLRRDADPYVAELLIRELAEDDSEQGEVLLRQFLASLRAAYAAEELAALLCAGGWRCFLLDGSNEMSLTAVLKRGWAPDAAAARSFPSS